MNDRFGLQVQTLGSGAQKVLVMADLVASKASDGRFRPAEVQQAFMGLQVPPPGNIPQTLANLRRQQATLAHGGGLWSLTPLGRQRVRDLVGEQAGEVESKSMRAPGAEFAHVLHTVIPPWAAPPRWQVGIKRLLEKHPFETNVFCMTRFPSEGPTPDPVTGAIETIRETLRPFGLTLHLASDRLLDDDLLTNVGAYMWGSQYGIGIVENLAKSGINYNAVIELGGMIVTGRRCAILKDRAIKSLPTDLSGQVYKTVDLADLSTVEAETRHWISADLGQ
jgi:hypothetical protein